MNAQRTTGHKVAAEVIGTFVLVFFGVGAAVMSAGTPSGYVTTASPSVSPSW